MGEIIFFISAYFAVFLIGVYYGVYLKDKENGDKTDDIEDDKKAQGRK